MRTRLSPRRPSSRLRLEPLEARENPASVVTASLSAAGVLTLTGSPDADDITLRISGSTTQITGNNGTQISVNGTLHASFNFAVPASSVTANLGLGDDVVTLDTTTDFNLPKSATFNLGDGANTVKTAGGGQVTLGGNLSVTAGKGADTVNLTGAAGSFIAGSASLVLGEGATTVKLVSVDVQGAGGLTVSAGTGNDDVTLDTSNVAAGPLSIQTGAGNLNLTVPNGLEVGGGLTVTAGGSVSATVAGAMTARSVSVAGTAGLSVISSGTGSLTVAPFGVSFASAQGIATVQLLNFPVDAGGSVTVSGRISADVQTSPSPGPNKPSIVTKGALSVTSAVGSARLQAILPVGGPLTANSITVSGVNGAVLDVNSGSVTTLGGITVAAGSGVGQVLLRDGVAMSAGGGIFVSGKDFTQLVGLNAGSSVAAKGLVSVTSAGASATVDLTNGTSLSGVAGITVSGRTATSLLAGGAAATVTTKGALNVTSATGNAGIVVDRAALEAASGISLSGPTKAQLTVNNGGSVATAGTLTLTAPKGVAEVFEDNAGVVDVGGAIRVSGNTALIDPLTGTTLTAGSIAVAGGVAALLASTGTTTTLAPVPVTVSATRDATFVTTGGTFTDAGGLTVTGGNVTTVFISSSPAAPPSTHLEGNVVVNGGTGNDQFTADGSLLADGSVTLNLGVGNNTVTVSQGAAAQAPAIGGALNITSLAGSDTVSLSQLQLGGNAKISLGAGADNLSILDGTTFGGNTSVDLGAGADQLHLADAAGGAAGVTFTGLATFLLGAGDDSAAVGLATGGPGGDANSVVTFGVVKNVLDLGTGANTFVRANSQVTGPLGSLQVIDNGLLIAILP